MVYGFIQNAYKKFHDSFKEKFEDEFDREYEIDNFIEDYGSSEDDLHHALCQLIYHDNSNVSECAAIAFRFCHAISDPEIIEELQHAAEKHEYQSVRKLAQESLQEIAEGANLSDELFDLVDSDGNIDIEQYKGVADASAPIPYGLLRSGAEFDVFISHASEDKEDVAIPLADTLKNNGVTVWLDEFTLKIGDDLFERINKGISKSNFAIVIFSNHFIRKSWTNFELKGIVQRYIANNQTILPILHRLTHEELTDIYPTLSGILSRNTSTSSLKDIAIEISGIIKGEKK